jgi:hypothetical protein
MDTRTTRSQSRAVSSRGETASTTSPNHRYVYLPTRLSGDAIGSYWRVGTDHDVGSSITITKVESREDVIPVGEAARVLEGRCTLSVTLSVLQEATDAFEEDAFDRQIGSLHGQYAYVPSTALDGVEGRPSWLIGQIDSLEALTENPRGRVFFKDGLTGLEHDLLVEGLDFSSIALVPRGIAAFGVFDSSLVSRNPAAKVRELSMSMLARLKAGETGLRTLLTDYFPRGASEPTILTSLSRFKLSEDWSETDELGSALTLPRETVIDQYRSSLGLPAALARAGPSLVPVSTPHLPTGHQPPTGLPPPVQLIHSNRVQGERTDALDEFLSRMGSSTDRGDPTPCANKKEKGEYQPGARSQNMSQRILHERHRGKQPHSLVMEQGRKCCFQPHPARLMSLYQGGIGTRYMSILHLKFLRPDQLLLEEELENGMDYSGKAKLPSVAGVQVHCATIKLCLRGLRIFSKEYWRQEIIDYCVDLESFFERVFESNEHLITNWTLVLKILDSLVQDTFTAILCQETEMTPEELARHSKVQLVSSNETIRSLWDRIISPATTSKRKYEQNGGNTSSGRGTSSSQDAPEPRRSKRVGDLLRKLPTIRGKSLCIKHLMGTCTGTKEGEDCPRRDDLIHSKPSIDEATMVEMRSIFGNRPPRVKGE